MTVRQRTGTRVEPRERWQWLDGELIAWLSRGRISHDELMAFAEARQIIEHGAAALAALRATDLERQAILDIYRRMERDQKNPIAAVTADKAFHMSILAATHNPVLQSLRQRSNPFLMPFSRIRSVHSRPISKTTPRSQRQSLQAIVSPPDARWRLSLTGRQASLDMRGGGDILAIKICSPKRGL